jgi:phosphatidylglycerophosphate synthase
MKLTDPYLISADDVLKKGPYPTTMLLRPLTMWLVVFSIKHKIHPNVLTLMMLVSVLVSCGLMFTLNVWAMIAGFINLQLFEVFDDADGIVARSRNKLSPYGQQLDFWMHMTCHPIIIATYTYWMYSRCNYNFIPNYDFTWGLVGLSIALVVVELSMRLMVCFDSLSGLRLSAEGVTSPAPAELSKLRIAFNAFKAILTVFPVFFSLFPICFIIDYFVQPSLVSIYVYLIFIGCYTLFYLKESASRLFLYMKPYHHDQASK